MQPCQALITSPDVLNKILPDKPGAVQIEPAMSQGITPVIPPKKHRVAWRDDDKERYTLRHRVENAFLHLKRWRGMATR